MGSLGGLMPARAATATTTLTAAQLALAERMRTDTLDRSIWDMCQTFRLRLHHSRPAQVKDEQDEDGHRRARFVTAILGNTGFPDHVIAGAAGFLFVETKMQRARLTPPQVEWRSVLLPTGRYRLWRPTDLYDHTIERELRAVAGMPPRREFR